MRARCAGIGKGEVIAGFAGATADAFTLLERLEAKLEQYPDQLHARLPSNSPRTGAPTSYLRRLEAMMLVADKIDDAWRSPAMATCWNRSMARWRIGSGGNYALAAARALMDTDNSAEEIASPRHEDRRRHLRLHQPQRHGRRRSMPTDRGASAMPSGRWTRTDLPLSGLARSEPHVRRWWGRSGRRCTSARSRDMVDARPSDAALTSLLMDDGRSATSRAIRHPH